MTSDRELLVTRVNTELNVAQRSTRVALENAAGHDPGPITERDEAENLMLYLQAIARSLQMLAVDVDALYDGV